MTIMNAVIIVLLAIIVLLLILAVLALFIPLFFTFTFNTVTSEMLLSMRWLSPFLKAEAETEKRRLKLTVFIFGIKIFSKTPRKRRKTRTDYLSALKLKDTYVNLSYGFGDPFWSGIACGAAEFVRLVMNIGDFRQWPAFMANEAYLIIDAGGKLNIGATADSLISFGLSDRRNRHKKRRKSYGSIGTQ